MRMGDFICDVCDGYREALIREGAAPPECCGQPMVRVYLPAAPTVRGDDIPGGLTIEHGICNDDGTPRTYYSHSEIQQACREKGWMRWTDVYTEDRTKDARVRADWYQSPEAKRAKALRDEARKEKRLDQARKAKEQAA